MRCVFQSVTACAYDLELSIVQPDTHRTRTLPPVLS